MASVLFRNPLLLVIGSRALAGGRAARGAPAAAGAEPADMMTRFQDPKADVSSDGVFAAFCPPRL